MAGPSCPSYIGLLARLDAARALGVQPGLDRVRTALDAVGAPDRAFVSLQIAGTNGKGSSAVMTDAILRAAGVRTGLFTSPHLCRFTERIRIDGHEIDGDHLATLDERLAATGIALTYFEISAALALMAMAEARVAVAVLETGLGGRLDAVTAVRPAATAITSIGIDHTDLLGATLPEIAREKAGIAKPGVPLWIAPLPAEAQREVAAVASAAGAPLRQVPLALAAATASRPDHALALRGDHQTSNAALAVVLAKEAAQALGRPLPESAIAAGLASVSWPGRLEWAAPDVLMDCAHNVDGARALATYLDRQGATPAGPRALVVSIAGDKDAAGIMATLAPRFDFVVATRSWSERALAPAALATLVAALVPATTTSKPLLLIDDPWAALSRARQFVHAGPGGAVVVTGSIFLVGQLRARLLGEACDPIPSSDPAPVRSK